MYILLFLLEFYMTLTGKAKIFNSGTLVRRVEHLRYLYTILDGKYRRSLIDTIALLVIENSESKFWELFK